MSAEGDVALGRLTQEALPTSLWRNRDFLLLWGGQLVSLVGTGASQLAFPLLVLALTASPLQAGLLAALRAVPYVTLALPAGALVDRWDRKRVMLVCEVSRALLVLSIPVALALDHFNLAQLSVVGILDGVGFTFYSIAEKARCPTSSRRSRSQPQRRSTKPPPTSPSW